MNPANPATNQLEDTVTKYLPFLLEIRKRLLFTLSLFIITGAIGFIYYEKVIAITLSLFSLDGLNIVFTSPFQFINLAINSGLLIGMVMLFPILIIQILSFLRPALHPKEFRTVVSLLPVSLLLFITGAGFGVLIMRYVVLIFYEKSVELNIGNFLDVSLLLSQILLTAVLMGLAFQFPVIMTVLMRLKVVHYKNIKKQRLWVYAVSLIFSAFLPPTDLLSLILLFLPLALLFEITLLLNRWVLKSHLL